MHANHFDTVTEALPLTTTDLDRIFPIEKFGQPNKAFASFLGHRYMTRSYRNYHKAFNIYLNDPRSSRFTYDNKTNMSLWLHVGDDNKDCSIHRLTCKGKHEILSVTITDLAFAEETSTLDEWSFIMNQPESDK